MERMPRREHSGATMIELIVAIVIGSILVVMVTQYFNSQNKTYHSAISMTEQRQGMRASMDLLQREVRAAGFDPTGIGFNGFDYDEKKLVIRADLNGDGDLKDAEERIEYFVDSKNDCLMRMAYSRGEASVGDKNESPDIVMEGVDAFEFEYFDGNGKPVQSSDGASEIKEVRMRLSLRNEVVTGAVADKCGNQSNELEVAVVPRNLNLDQLAFSGSAYTGDGTGGGTSGGDGGGSTGGDIGGGSTGGDPGGSTGGGTTDPGGGNGKGKGKQK